jgi:hypothetical protein
MLNGFNMDLGAYVVAADSNSHLNAQLTMPSGVTTRWAPRFKITNWTNGAPIVTWGGTILTAGTDYNYIADTTTNTLYLQLDSDVVISGAKTGQMVNAPLDVS